MYSCNRNLAWPGERELDFMWKISGCVSVVGVRKDQPGKMEGTSLVILFGIVKRLYKMIIYDLNCKSIEYRGIM